MSSTTFLAALLLLFAIFENVTANNNVLSTAGTLRVISRNRASRPISAAETTTTALFPDYLKRPSAVGAENILSYAFTVGTAVTGGTGASPNQDAKFQALVTDCYYASATGNQQLVATWYSRIGTGNEVTVFSDAQVTVAATANSALAAGVSNLTLTATASTGADTTALTTNGELLALWFTAYSTSNSDFVPTCGMTMKIDLANNSGTPDAANATASLLSCNCQMSSIAKRTTSGSVTTQSFTLDVVGDAAPTNIGITFRKVKSGVTFADSSNLEAITVAAVATPVAATYVFDAQTPVTDEKFSGENLDFVFNAAKVDITSTNSVLKLTFPDNTNGLDNLVAQCKEHTLYATLHCSSGARTAGVNTAPLDATKPASALSGTKPTAIKVPGCGASSSGIRSMSTPIALLFVALTARFAFL